MSPLRLSGSTSGYSQLDAPAIAGDQTFTLPGTGGTIDRLNRAGNILQVVEGSLSTAATTTSGSYVDVGLSASITPTSTSNKVLVLITNPAYMSRTGVDAGAMFALLRGSNIIWELPIASSQYIGVFSTTSTLGFTLSFTHLDSPSTTSSATYKLQQKTYVSTSLTSAYAASSGAKSSIYLLEVAA